MIGLPEQKLALAVLEMAWCDALIPLNKNYLQRKVSNRTDAIKFMEGTEDDWRQSFSAFCVLANVDPVLMRNGYFKFKRIYKKQSCIYPASKGFKCLISVIQNNDERINRGDYII